MFERTIPLRIIHLAFYPMLLEWVKARMDDNSKTMGVRSVVMDLNGIERNG